MSKWEENLKIIPELEEIKTWLNQGNKNDFFSSIVDQATKRDLSAAQVEVSRSKFERIKNPVNKVKFNEFEIQVFSKILSLMIDISPMGGDFYSSLRNQLIAKNELSEKQWTVLKEKFKRFRKSILKKLFA